MTSRMITHQPGYPQRVEEEPDGVQEGLQGSGGHSDTGEEDAAPGSEVGGDESTASDTTEDNTPEAEQASGAGEAEGHEGNARTVKLAPLQERKVI